MSREALQESLSALLDNEADELELRRVLAASTEQPELRSQWQRYQVARAALHKELREPNLDLAASVSAVLASEAPLKPALRPWRALTQLAVAASVTVAVLSGVHFYNQDDTTEALLAQQEVQPLLSLPQVQGPAILAGYSAQEAAEAGAVSDIDEQRVLSYLHQHAQQAGAAGATSVLPYARAASLDNR